MNNALFFTDLQQQQSDRFCLYILPFPKLEYFKFGVTSNISQRLSTHRRSYEELGENGLVIFSCDEDSLRDAERGLKSLYKPHIASFVNYLTNELDQTPDSNTEILPISQLSKFKSQLFSLISDCEIQISNPIDIYSNVQLKDKLKNFKSDIPSSIDSRHTIKKPKSQNTLDSQDHFLDETLTSFKSQYLLLNRCIPIFLASIVSATEFEYINDEGFERIDVYIHTSEALARLNTSMESAAIAETMDMFLEEIRKDIFSISASHCSIKNEDGGHERFHYFSINFRYENLYPAFFANISLRLIAGLAASPIMSTETKERFMKAREALFSPEGYYLENAFSSNLRTVGI